MSSDDETAPPAVSPEPAAVQAARPARGRWQPGPWMRRLARPGVLLLVSISLFLPFLTASCDRPGVRSPQWRVTYTGADLVAGGRPDIDFTDDSELEPMRRLDGDGVRNLLGELAPALPAQPMALAAVALLLVLAASAALPARWRAPATAGSSLAAAVVMWGAVELAKRDAADDLAGRLMQVASTSRTPAPSTAQVRQWDQYDAVHDLFRAGYGFWVAVASLAVLGVANVVQVLRDPALRRQV
jgi:hypothetical protein